MAKKGRPKRTKLSERNRAICKLRLVENKPLKYIGDIFKISNSAVRKVIVRNYTLFYEENKGVDK